MTKEEAIKSFEEDNHTMLENKTAYINELKARGMEFENRMVSYIDESVERNELAISALKGGWIPLEDGYPEELKADDGYVYPSDYVLTFDSHGMYGTSRYWGNRTSKRERPDDYLDWMDLPFYKQDILAWQPLPEPYKKGE